jgi:hypothetical protein
MALLKNIISTLNYELTSKHDICKNKDIPLYIQKEVQLSNCYVQIFNVSGNKDSMCIEVVIYLDSTKSTIIEHKKYWFTPNTSNDSMNFIKQGYEYLKTLPEYENALDVLEEGQCL